MRIRHWIFFFICSYKINAGFCEAITKHPVDPEDDGAIAAARFMATKAVRQQFLPNINSMDGVLGPWKISGTRLDVPGFVYDLKFHIRAKDAGVVGVLECHGVVWDENRNQQFRTLEPVDCLLI